jgi:hypothetical protein
VDPEKQQDEKRAWENDLDGLADFHARLSKCESFDVALSRRVTALEETGRGHFNDDPMKQMAPVIWVMVFLTVAPLVLDLVKAWRSSQLS